MLMFSVCHPQLSQQMLPSIFIQLILWGSLKRFQLMGTPYCLTTQALVNILEKPQKCCNLEAYSKPSYWTFSFLGFPSQAIEQLVTEMLFHLLAQEHFSARYYNKVFSCDPRTTCRNWNIELQANSNKSIGKKFHKLDKGSYWCRRYFWACKGYYSIRPSTTTSTMGISCFGSL